jgi:uncharacterized protein YoxC
MNWTAFIFIAIAIIALVIFLVARNLKDKRDFENQLNNDYHKSKDQEGDEDPETITK